MEVNMSYLILVLVLGAATGVGTYSYSLYKKYVKNKLKAIDEAGFKNILKKYNLKEKYDDGRILCSISGQPITFDNLGYIDMRSNGEILFISRTSLPSAAQTPMSELKPLVI
jgi:hypothetical protein